MVASTAVDQADDLSSASRSELDSHANMVVLGRNCFVFDGVHGKTCDVEPFDPKLGKAKKVPVVDAAVAYDCPYSHQTFLFILRNALYIPTLEHNLIPPFIMNYLNKKPFLQRMPWLNAPIQVSIIGVL